MAKRAAKFTERDVRRFVRGLQAAGVKPTRFEASEDGRLIAFVDSAPPDDDAELAEFRQRHGYG
jgi:hypothetical protein